MNKVLTDNQIDLIESKFEITPDSIFRDFDKILEHVGILKEDIPTALLLLTIVCYQIHYQSQSVKIKMLRIV